jgi:hypothetical protein
MLFKTLMSSYLLYIVPTPIPVTTLIKKQVISNPYLPDTLTTLIPTIPLMTLILG